MPLTKTKRIPVSVEIWKRLGKEKEAGETYDDLISKLLQAHNRLKLMKKMKQVEEAQSEDLVDLDDL
jgi:predicted CopG family antitoxin